MAVGWGVSGDKTKDLERYLRKERRERERKGETVRMNE